MGQFPDRRSRVARLGRSRAGGSIPTQPHAHERGRAGCPAQAPDSGAEAIGDPAIARPSEDALAVLGRSGVQILPGDAPMTPAAAALWDAGRLHGECVRSPAVSAAIADAAVRTSDPPLDDSQRAAIAGVVSRRLSVIWGPPARARPGPAAAMVHQLANHESRRDSGIAYNMLLTGPNYKAVAELAERVMWRMSVDGGHRSEVLHRASGGKGERGSGYRRKRSTGFRFGH